MNRNGHCFERVKTQEATWRLKNYGRPKSNLAETTLSIFQGFLHFEFGCDRLNSGLARLVVIHE